MMKYIIITFSALLLSLGSATVQSTYSSLPNDAYGDWSTLFVQPRQTLTINDDAVIASSVVYEIDSVRKIALFEDINFERGYEIITSEGESILLVLSNDGTSAAINIDEIYHLEKQ